MNVKEEIQKLKQKFPQLEIVTIEYHGSGDSFEEFWGIESTPKIDINQNDIEDLLWYAIEHSEADFNNDGSKGSITINLIEEQLTIDNYWLSIEENPSGIKIIN